MFTIIWKIVELGLNFWGNYKLKQASTEVERAQIAADVEKNKDNIKGAILLNGAWWFQLFFIIPLAVWFAGVVLYSLLWCSDCVYPQPWSIAALPPPLDQWAGWIIGFLFLVNATGVKR